MKSLQLFGVSVSLAGCATWHHPTKNNQEFHADKAECHAMSGAGTPNQVMPAWGAPGYNTGWNQGWNQGAALGASIQRSVIFNDCMVGKGWTDD
jgi:hypothetical protein